MRKVTIYIIILFIGSFSYGQRLESLIKIGLENSPEIQKVETAYKGVLEKKNEVDAVPNTQFGFGYFASEPETRTGAQRFKLSVKQMIPWFGSITARQSYVSSIADAKFEDIAIAKRKLIASVSQGYYNLFTIREKQEILKKNVSLLKTYETMALTSVETGKATVVDVLKLQIRQNDLEQLIEVLEQQFLSEQTQVNTLLNREKNFKIEVLDSLVMPKSLDVVSTDNLSLHPELLKYDKLYKSVEQSELLNQKEQKPMIGFGLDYVTVSERPNMSFSDNGKDIVMPMVSLSIPIFNKKYSSKSKQNQLKQEELLFDKQVRQNKLMGMLDAAINGRVASKISFDTYTRNLEKADNAEQILLKSYESGTINFNDVLDIQELQLKFQMKQIEAIKGFYMQSTIINYLSM
ncbi:MAG: TolC family protein [Flavobacteriaceae bacterium]